MVRKSPAQVVLDPSIEDVILKLGRNYSQMRPITGHPSTSSPFRYEPCDSDGPGKKHHSLQYFGDQRRYGGATIYELALGP